MKLLSMHSALCIPFMALALACGPADPDDTPTATPTEIGDGAGEAMAIVATVAEDYSVGALATVNLDSGALTDTITDVTGDVAVVANGGYVFVLQRFGSDTVRVYEPGTWTAPITEFALDDFANPHDVQMCGDSAFITEYGTEKISIYNPIDGSLEGTIDLSAYNSTVDVSVEEEGDASVEASHIVLAPNGKLYVALQDLDRNYYWASVGGKVLEIDCESKSVTQSWDVNSPAIFANPGDDSNLIVLNSGVGLHTLDTETGTLSDVKLSMETAGVNMVTLAAMNGAAMMITNDASFNYSVDCVDLSTWAFTEGETTQNYLIDVQANDRGEAWVSARTHWSNPSEVNGLNVYDIESCTRKVSDPIESLLAPFSVAFY